MGRAVTEALGVFSDFSALSNNGTRTMSHLYLRKTSDNPVDHCKCAPEDAVISAPQQMECPWCGCGWLFICRQCHKVFTFAEAFEISETWTETARRDLSGPSSDEEIESWISAMRVLMKGVAPGHTYVYIDGWFMPTDEQDLEFEGWHSRHRFAVLPQVAALQSHSQDNILASRDYWAGNQLDNQQDA